MNVARNVIRRPLELEASRLNRIDASVGIVGAHVFHKIRRWMGSIFLAFVFASLMLLFYTVLFRILYTALIDTLALF